MRKILISVFDDEQTAYSGLSVLKDLHRDGDITLYASAVVVKEADGSAVIRQVADPGPVGTLVGTLAGALIGVLGGPVGIAVGAFAGGTSGLFYDLFETGVQSDVIDDVSAALEPGKAVVITDIDETWTTPVESRLSALGATNYRWFPDEVFEEAVTREVETRRQELEQYELEVSQAEAEARTELETRIAAERQHLAALADRIDATLKQRRAEVDARVATLRAQISAANAARRSQVQARIEELQHEWAERSEKLERARDLARESAALTKEAIAV